VTKAWIRGEQQFVATDPIQLARMTVSPIDAHECREQAKYCRELAMSTPDPRTERLLLEAANDMDREASEIDAGPRAAHR